MLRNADAHKFPSPFILSSAKIEAIWFITLNLRVDKKKYLSNTEVAVEGLQWMTVGTASSEVVKPFTDYI